MLTAYAARQDAKRRDARFHTVRPYDPARAVACAQVGVPYRRYQSAGGSSWDVCDGQSQFARCAPDAGTHPAQGQTRADGQPLR